MTTTTKTMQEAALDLVAQGYKVFPLIPRLKKPLAGSSGFKDATQIQQRVKEFWPKGSQNNIGLVCDGLLVCDFDRGEIGQKSLARMEAKYGKLPRTWTIRTGGGTIDEPHEQGLQYVYRAPQELNIRPGAGVYSLDDTILEKFDIRANSSYIVAVPSITRLPYETIDDSPVADAPQWLIDIALKPKKETISQSLGVAAGEPIPAGSQDAWLTSQAGVYRARGDDEEAIFEKLKVDILRCPQEPGRQLYTEADFRRIAHSVCKYPAGGPKKQEENNGLPEIRVTGRNTKDITADAIDALNKSNNPPTMFMRGSLPVRVSKDECDTPYIEVMNEPALRGRLDRVATYVKYVKNQGKQEGDEYKAVPTAVPLDVVRDVMSLPDFRLPALINITEIPTLRADGSILATPGYDPASKLYYAPSRNLIVPKISESPTAKEIREAVNLINEVYINFPFDSQASRANAIAATATCIYRPMFDGNVPLFIISKPQAGVGAGLMTAAICMTTTGRDPAMFGAPKDEDEWAKVIFAAVKAGQQTIIFDNCDGVLYSANLARLITARTIGGRILGRSENAVMPNNSMIFCNGNNITLDGDLPRRSYLSRMETDADMPWERECNYLHSPLIPWVKANQGSIVAAYLTIAKAWIAAGKPLDDSLPRLGSFEEWQTVIGGVLKNAAIEGFLGNRETVYRISDTGSQQWETFTEALTSVFPEDFTVADIANLIFPKKDTEITSQGSDLKNALPDLIDKDLRQFSTSLGRALNKKLNVKWHNGWVITKPEGVKPRHHAVVWKIINWRENSAQTTTGEVTSPPPVSQGRLGEDKPLPTHYKTDNNNSYIETGVVTSPTSPLGTKKGEVTQKAPGKLEKLGKCPVCGKEDTEGMWTDDSPEGYYFYCTNCFVTFVPTTE